MKNKPKLLFVFHGSELNNGGTRSLMEIVDYLIDSEDYDIRAIFPSRGTAAEHLYEKGITKVQYYKYGGLMQDLNQSICKRIIKFPLLLLRHITIICNAYRAYKANKDENLDIVYNNTSSILFGGYLGTFLKCKTAWHIREYRVKDHRISFYLGESYLKRFINRHSDCVFFVSKGTMKEVVDVIDEKKCVVTYNSYPKSFIKHKVKIRDNGTYSILIAGDIKPSKGQMVCVEAIGTISKLHGVKLYIAGKVSNREYYNDILKYIEDNELNSEVTLLGQVSDMLSLRENMDIGIVASDCEAFGRTTIEGMLCELAMIGRNTGGTPEQITDGITGLLYDGTAQNLAEKISELIDNPILMRTLALAGCTESITKYTDNNAARIVKASLDNIIQNSYKQQDK